MANLTGTMMCFMFNLLAVLQLTAASYPAPRQALSEPVVLNDTEVNYFTPWTKYASLTYCVPQYLTILNNNKTLSDNFELEIAGGNAKNARYFYVGYDKQMKTVVVAHAGHGGGGEYVHGTVPT